MGAFVTQKEFEDSVVEMLLAGPEKVYANLLEQYKSAQVESRDITGSGFFTTYKVQKGIRNYELSGRIDGVVARYKDEYDFQLFYLIVANGTIDYLEGVSMVNPWNNDYAHATLEYAKRDGPTIRFELGNGELFEAGTRNPEC